MIVKPKIPILEISKFPYKTTTESEIRIETCSKCHPFYTGIDNRKRKAGKVDKFNKKYGFDTKGE